MKLHAVNRVMLVANGHHGSVLTPRAESEGGRKGRRIDDERVVTHGLERSRQSVEDAVVLVMNEARLAVHHFSRPEHATAVMVNDELVPEAHAEDGYVTAELFEDGTADTDALRVGRVAGARGKDDP